MSKISKKLSSSTSTSTKPITIVRLMILSLIIILLIIADHSECKCPSKSGSFCLQIDGFDSILLDGSQFTNITNVFKNIELLFDSDNITKELDQLLLLNNNRLELLDQNVFCDFHFRHIVIRNCTKLKYINRLAFNNTKQYLRSLKIEQIGIQSGKNSDEFFESLNILDNLEELELRNNRLLNISEYQFRQKRLKSINLDGPFDTIQNNAFFYLDNLSIIRFSKSIRRIKQHAFHFRLQTNKTLDIYFDCKIGFIERRIFLSTQRPLTINLYLNKLINFDSQIFRPILMEQIKHELILHGNPKEMRNPCQLLWLFRNKHRFKGVFQFKDEPLINESYFDQYRCTNQMIYGQQQQQQHSIFSQSSSNNGHNNGHNNHGIITHDGRNNDNEIHEEMNNIDRAGNIDASHNNSNSIHSLLSTIFIIALTILMQTSFD